MIETSMRQYLVENPRLKYVFFGGKGGVGKTVLAGTAALWGGSGCTEASSSGLFRVA